jgi:chloramphenicol-sensitive protein RarD
MFLLLNIWPNMPITETTKGFVAAIVAFIIWALLPIYWKALQTVSAHEILCHRIIWSAVFAGSLLLLTKRIKEAGEAFTSLKNIGQLAVSSILIAGNWFLYIWGVNAGYVVECSLGYYINPLVNVLLGYFFFGERMRPLQLLAICFALGGVINELIHFGRLPWIALILAFSFSIYGMTRKVMKLGPVPGLFVETCIVSIPALFFISSLMLNGQSTLGGPDITTNLLLLGAGTVTSIPLILFAYAARRLKLSTLGLLQYIGPSGMLLIGIFIYDEPFETATLITFMLIWFGVALYSVESILYMRKSHLPG